MTVALSISLLPATVCARRRAVSQKLDPVSGIANPFSAIARTRTTLTTASPRTYPVAAAVPWSRSIRVLASYAAVADLRELESRRNASSQGPTNDRCTLTFVGYVRTLPRMCESASVREKRGEGDTRVENTSDVDVDVEDVLQLFGPPRSPC